MLPDTPPARGVLFRIAIIASLSFTLAAIGAEEVVEMETDYTGIIGKLKEEVRSSIPEVESASEDGKHALARMQLPPGIVASLWAAEPMLANPVAFNFDERGRIFVAETFRYGSSVLDIRAYMWLLEDDLANRNQADFMASLQRNFGADGVKALSQETERISLLEDTNGDGVADKSSIYAENFRTPIDGVASGVLARRGEVWLTNIPSLWHFSGKEKAETRTELLRGFGLRFNYTGHDLHGLIFGPDGRIYFSIGDRGASVKNQEGRLVDAPDTGSVFRCYPDGSQLELFATGLRNPQSLLFNEFGDLFTGDNDSDQGDEERLVHVVEDGDSGWRIGYQHAPLGNAGPWNLEKLWRPRFPSQPSYLLPPIANIEDGPSGIAYYPGTGLTPEYANTIFITHFKGSIARSGIYTYKLKPAGASYAIEDNAPFLTNSLPTDVRFGPDGRLYYSDWAEGWPKSKRGRIYAMFDPTRVNDPLVKSTQKLIASDPGKKSETELAGLLAHPDWRVRLDAQYALANRGASSVKVLASIAGQADVSPLARRHAVWGLGQVAAKTPAAIVSLRVLLNSADDEVAAQAAKLLGEHGDQASASALTELLSAPHRSARAKFFSAQSLGKLKHTAATAALVAAVRANSDADAYLRHALVMGLAGCATPTELAALKADGSRSVRLAAVLALRRQADAEVVTFLADADELVVREAALAINDAPIPGAFPALAAFVEKPVASEAVMLRALNAHFRLGTNADAAALAAYAVQDNAPLGLRREALTLLALWSKPPARDRIVGIYRPLREPTRDSSAVVQALTPHLANLMAQTSPASLRIATLKVVGALEVKHALPLVRAVVLSKDAPDAVRTVALTTLDKLHDPQLADAITAALAANSSTLRLAALPISTRLHPETAIATVTQLLEKGGQAERRAAYTTLGGLPHAEADLVVGEELKKLAAGHVSATTQVELLEAAQLRSAPAVKQLLSERESAAAQSNDPLALFRVSLQGGDRKKGRSLFYYHPVLACIRCHVAEGDDGGEAGPRLTGIGGTRTAEYILQSIVKPSAAIAPGFDTQMITRKSGALVAGILVSENDTEVRLRDSNGKEQTLKKDEIANRTSVPSSMPEIYGAIMTKSELRDLVAYIASLKQQGNLKPAPLRALRPTPAT